MKKFYSEVSIIKINGGMEFTVTLDKNPLKTPDKRLLVLPSFSVAEAIASEWRRQKDIIKIVKENPGITQSMISQQLDTSRQKINYHVNCLSNNSILRVEKHGRITRLYPMHFT